MTRCCILILLQAFLDPVVAQEPATVSPPAVEIDPAAVLLDFVHDRTELAYEERAAYFGILNHVRRVAPDDLHRAAADFVHRRWSESQDLHTPQEQDFPLFADMLKRPAEYRGQPVLLRGHVIRVVKYPGDDAYGLDPLYEAWLVTPDAQRHPTTVIFSELPPGLALGDDLVDGVSVAGYFLKLHLYASRDGKGRVAPLILARTMTVSAPAGVNFPVPVPVIYMGVIALIGSLVFFTWRASRGDRAFQAERRTRMNEASPPDLAALESLDVPSFPPAPPSD
jgi:hypothetical protein